MRRPAYLLATLLTIFSPRLSAALPHFDGAPALFNTGHHVSDVAVADLDRDGILDAVAAVETGLVFLHGLGDGSLATAVDVPGSPCDQVLAVDIDHDGFPELIAASRARTSVQLFRSSGAGLVADVLYELGLAPLALAAGDLNQDGLPDLVACGESSVSVLLAGPDGHLAANHVTGGIVGGRIALADFNRDGHLDLASHGGSFYGFVSIALGDGAGGFAQPNIFFTTQLPGALAAADLNGDGIVDLAFTGGFTPVTLGFLPGIGNGTFGPVSTTPIDFNAGWLIAKDLDQNGTCDLLAAGGIQVATLLGNGSGAFSPGGTAMTPWYVAGVLLDDLDRDGVPDLVAGSRTDGYPFPDNLVVMKGRADGTFGGDRIVPTAGRPEAVATGDFNGDGHQDLVTANLDAGSLSLLPGHGDGSFGPRLDLPVHGPVYPLPIDVKIADVNEDGRGDLLVTQIASDGVSVFLQQAGGAWGPQTTYSTGQVDAQEWRFAVGDVNGDGHLDVVAAAHYAPVVSVLLGRGDGGFQAPHVLPVGGGPFFPVIADFDADGNPDIVVSDVGAYPYGQGGLWFLQGVGGGNFAAPRSLYSSSTYALCAADLNQDGRLDVAAWAGTVVLVLSGNGAGGFAPAPSVHLGSDALWGIASGDFDLDGRIDLAGVDVAAHAVTVSDAGNGWLRSYGVRWNPTSILSGDFNEDGRPDLAIANSGANSVSVLLNRDAAPAPIEVSFELTPGTLDLASRGLWVTGFLEPAPPASADDIDIASIRLNGTVPVDPAAPAALGDHDGNGVPDLMVKFDRTAVELSLTEGDDVAVTVTGSMGGQSFVGTDHIRVRRAAVSAPVAGSRLTAGSVTEVRWQIPSGVTIQSVALMFSSDDGATWSPVAHGQPNSGSYFWTVPEVGTERAKLAVVLVESADATGELVEGVLGVSGTFSIATALGVGDRGPGPFALAIRATSPNPSPDGRLRVEFGLRDDSPARLELVDVAGRVVTSWQVGSLGPGRHTLELSEGGALRPGIYFVHLTQGSGEVRARAAVLK